MDRSSYGSGCLLSPNSYRALIDWGAAMGNEDPEGTMWSEFFLHERKKTDNLVDRDVNVL
jgi:hypothetical protein